jgi:1,4-dihydroxy-2-naphthoyl-CoA hydrolase
MAIWKQAVTLGPISSDPRLSAANSCGAHLGLRLTEIGEDYLRGTLPVDNRTKQPYGRLHGGASCVLAEELGSTAAALCTDPKEVFVVGLEINANHIRAATGGTVTGTARPLHIGRATQVWEIRIEDEQQKLVCISRLTMAVVKLSEGKKA